nr:sigma-70 family RNA polymerase sigma factor [Paenibacillus ginsengarvi]
MVNKYSKAVCSVAYGVTKDFHAAQDIAQETFLKASNQISKLQQPEKFGSWLYSIAKRKSIDYIRKVNKEKMTPSKLDFSVQQTPIEKVEASEIQTDV